MAIINTFRKVTYLSVVFLLCCFTYGKAQVNVTATAGTTGPTNYATISAAFTAINAGTHQGVINISITGNTTEPGANTALLKSGGLSSYTSIIIRPSGGNWTIGGTATANRAIIELSGADNVTIDGDDPAMPGGRNLTIGFSTTAAVVSAVIRISSNSNTGLDGASNNVIRNCNLTGPRTGVSDPTITYGINMSNYSTTNLASGGASSINNIFENNNITRCNNGIHCLGLANYPHTGLIIRNNTIGDGTAGGNVNRGIFTSFTASTAGQTAAIISGNDVQAGDPGSTSYIGQAIGMEINTNNYGIQIFSNNIHDVRKPAAGYGVGILVNGAANMNGMSIFNNFIRDIAGARTSASYVSTSGAFGVLFTGGASSVNIDHNTIWIRPSTVVATVANNFSAAIMYQVNGVTVNSMRNNIILNTDTSANAYGVYAINTANISGATIDKNNYHVGLGKIGYYNGAAQTTIAGWRTATGKDLNAYNIFPAFVSTNDLHVNGSVVSPLESGGVTGIGISTDVDGQSRPGPAGSVNGGGTSPDVGADEFDGVTAPCASTPFGLTSSAITTTTTTIAWTAANPAPAGGYEYFVSTSNVAPLSTDAPTGTTTAGVTSASLNGLNANTTYYFWVRSRCDVTQASNWAGFASFITPCNAFTLNVSQGFNALTIPACWTQSYVTGTSNLLYATGSINPATTPQEGSHFVFWNSNAIASGNETRLISPPINTVGTASVDVQFQWFHDNTAFTGAVYADEGVSIEYSLDGLSWTAVGTPITRLGGINGWTLKNLTLPAAAGNQATLYVAFRFKSRAGNNCALDAVLIRPTPACAAQPSGVSSSSITSTSAVINWTAASPNPAAGYEFYYSTSAAFPLPTVSPSGSVAAGVVTANISGLTANTTYYFWVRSVCNATDKSSWTSTSFFTTLPPCIISSFPWVERFDGMPAIGNSIFPECWVGQSTSGTPWASMNAGGNTYNDPFSAPNYITCYYSPYSGVTKYLITPGFSLTAGISYDFSFKYAGDANSGWTADVGYNTTQNGAGMTVLGTPFINGGTTSSTYTDVLRSFTPATSGVYYFVIRVTNTISPWYLGFDNFSVALSPACSQQPSGLASGNITTTGATISWTAATPAPAAGYQYFISNTNTTPLASATPTGSVGAGITSAVVTGLSANTTYYFWVRSVCNATDQSSWVGSSSFTTLCANATIPWSEHFDAMSAIGTNLLPTCWKSETPSNNPWASMNAGGNTYNDPLSVPNYITCYYVPSAVNKHLITPGFTLTAGTTYNFSFQFAGDGYTGWTGEVGANTSQTGTGMTVLGAAFITGGTTSVTNYTTVSRLFTPSTSGTYYFVIRINNNGVPWYLGFDNFNLVVVPPCAGVPTAGTATVTPSSGSVGSSIQLNATGFSNATGISFQWQSGPSATGPWTNIPGATTVPYTATAVSTLTTTYYRLVATCSASGLSANSPAISFVTTYCPPVFNNACTSNDYINDFSINTLSNLSSGCNGNANNYIQYAPSGALTTTLTQGVSYNATVNIGRGGDGNVAIWIDFNNNGVFETSERFANTVLVPSSGTVVIPVLIPSGAAPGLRAMRVREVFASSFNGNLGPCAAYGFGETEDYIVTINAQVPCTGTPNPGNTLVNLTNVCVGSSANLSIQNQVTGSGVSYQWQSSTDNSTYANIAGATGSSYTAVINSSTWYRCVVSCGSVSSQSTPILVNAVTCVFMPVSGTASVTTCNGFFYDSGGETASYSNNENGTITIFPSTPGTFVSLNFSEFSVETCCDNLKIFNGNSVNAPLLGTYTTNPGTITSTAADGSLTLVFTSDFSIANAGWVAAISCYVPPPCAGMPIPGLTQVTQPFVCIGNSSTFSVANPPSGSGVTYQWQIAPDVAGSPGAFVNIAGASMMTYVYTPTVAATNWYRCLVTCAGNAATSVPVQVIASACTVINMPVSGSTNTCSAQFYDSGGASGNYSDNETRTYTIFPSTPGGKVRVQFNAFNVETCCDYLRIYDGNSITAPLIGSYNASPGTITSTAADGSLTFYFFSDGSVTRSGWDATVTCFIPPPCAGVPAGGNAVTSPSTGPAGSAVTLTASGISAVTGLSYQWQTSTNGTTWSNIPGATTIPYIITAPGVPGVVSMTYYQVLVTCSNSGITVTSEPTTFITASYCTPSHTSTGSNYINKISFLGTMNDLNNNSTYNSSGYQDFTGLPNRSKQAQGEGINLYVQSNNSAYTKAWVDWDNDGTFSGTEQVYSSNSILTSTTTFGFRVPLTTTPGLYRIRIRTNTGTQSYDACTTLSSGETEDYLFEVVSTCDMFINSVTNGQVCGGGPVTLAVTASSGAITYNWYAIPSGGTPVATTNIPSWTTPNIVRNTVYYVTASSASCEGISRVPILAAIATVPTLTFNPTTPVVCGEGAILRLNASGDTEEAIVFRETFENGLGIFSVSNLINNGATVNAQTQWQSKTSVFVPDYTEVWRPAISSGVGADKFAFTTSDIIYTEVNTAMVSPSVSTVGFQDLFLDFSVYYSHYLPDGVNSVEDSLVIEVSTNNGNTWTPAETYVIDQGIGTRFSENSINITSFINNSNVQIRFRYHGDWADGAAIDNVKLWGYRPLSTTFAWSPINQNNLFVDSAGQIPYTGTSVSQIFIRPTISQLDTANSLTFTASATLSNGCSAQSPVTVSIIPSQWTGDVSTDWHNINNWCSKTIPASTTKVDLPAGLARYPVISAPAFANTIRIFAGASLTINATGSISVRRDFENAGILTNNGLISMNGTIAQQFPGAAGTINAMSILQINNTGPGVFLNKSFTIDRELRPTSGLFSLGDFDITLRSTLQRTAAVSKIGPSAGFTYGTGRFIVERFIPTGINHGKSWQLLAIPTNGGQTINSAWQEGATSPNANPVPGYGTQLTSNLANATTIGFDAYTPTGASMKSLNTLGTWTGVGNTRTTPIYDSRGYMVFVRGDRSVINFSGANSAPLPTVLRTRGKIFDASDNLPPETTILAGKFAAVGNPYASAIDFANPDGVIFDGPPYIENAFYSWDPTLAGSQGLGGYQTISGLLDWVPTPGGTFNYPANVENSRIMSGQSFLMRGAQLGGTVSFVEDAKVDSARMTLRSTRRSSLVGSKQIIKTHLYSMQSGTPVLADGNTVVMHPDLSNAYTSDDAVKMSNGGENFGLQCGSQWLAIEARAEPVNGDTIYFSSSNLRNINYRLVLSYEPTSTSTCIPYLFDRHTQVLSPVMPHSIFTYDFNVQSGNGSAASNRFMIVFRPVQTLPVTSIRLNAQRRNKQEAVVQWRTTGERDVLQFEVQRSRDAITFESIGTLPSSSVAGGTAAYAWTDLEAGAEAVYYRIAALDYTGGIRYSDVHRIQSIKLTPSVLLHSVSERTGTIDIDCVQLEPGTYTYEVFSSSGQLVGSNRLFVQSPVSRQTIDLGSQLASGTYQLRVISSKGAVFHCGFAWK